MAVRHKCRPFWAVQYHPESVCTEGGGLHVIHNFWRLAQTWAKGATSSMRTLPWNANLQAVFGHHWPYLPAHSPPRSSVPFLRVITSAVERLGLSVTDVCESMGAFEESSSFVLLYSASHPGHFSVVGCLSPSSLRITYRVGDRFVSLARDGSLRKSNSTPLRILATSPFDAPLIILGVFSFFFSTSRNRVSIKTN